MTTVDATGAVDSCGYDASAPPTIPSPAVHRTSNVAATAVPSSAHSAATAHDAATIRAARLATAVNLRTTQRAPSSRFRVRVAHFPS